MAAIHARHGRLVVDFRYRGIRCRERTSLGDTPENRRRLQKVVERLEAAILLDTFQYDDYFPGSPRIAQFRDIDHRIEQGRSSTPAFADFAETWFVESAVGWRHSHKTSVRTLLDHHLLPRFGACRVDEVSRADVLQFRAELGNGSLRT